MPFFLSTLTQYPESKPGQLPKIKTNKQIKEQILGEFGRFLVGQSDMWAAGGEELWQAESYQCAKSLTSRQKWFPSKIIF